MLLKNLKPGMKFFFEYDARGRSTEPKIYTFKKYEIDVCSRGKECRNWHSDYLLYKFTIKVFVEENAKPLLRIKEMDFDLPLPKKDLIKVCKNSTNNICINIYKKTTFNNKEEALQCIGQYVNYLEKQLDYKCPKKGGKCRDALEYLESKEGDINE